MLSDLQQRISTLKNSSELLSGTAWAFLMKIVGLGTGYLFTFAVSRILGAQAWGAFSITLTVITFTTILGRLGLDTALLRSVSQYRVQVQQDAVIDAYFKVLRVVVPFSILLSLVTYLLAPWLANVVFNKPNLTFQFRIGCLAILPVAVVFVNTQALRGLKRIRESVFLNLVARNLFALVAFLALVPLFLEDVTVISAFVIGAYANAVISALFFLKYARESEPISGTEGNATPIKVSYRGLLAVALPLLLASSLQFIKGWTDTIMLGIYMTEVDVGVYNVAFKLATLISLVLVATNAIAAPKFAELNVTHDRAGLERSVRQSSRLILIASLPIFLFIVLFPEQLLGIFGAEYKVASTALVILAVAYFFNAVAGSVGVLLQMTGHQVFFQNITLAVVILGIVLNYLLIPRMGINGAAVATCIGVIIWNLGCVLYVRQQFGFVTIYNPFSRSNRITQ